MKPTKQIVPTSTVSEARLRIFQPSQKPIRKTIMINTVWGTATVTGRLGQRHADALEAIRSCALSIKKSEMGVSILVDPYEVRKRIGTGYYSLEQLRKLLEELRDASVRIDTPEFSGYGGLISEYLESKKPMQKKGTGVLNGKERYLMIIQIGKVGVTLLENDIPLYYDPIPIAQLKSGMSQAIARHVLTHKREPKGGWLVDTLIEAVAGVLPSVQKAKARAAIKRDINGFIACGIVVDNGRIRLSEVDPN